MEPLLVRDLMTAEPLVVRAHDSVHAAIALLALGSIRHLPVTDDAGALVGMLSDRDVLGVLLPQVAPPEAPDDMSVADVMSRDVVFVSPDEALGPLIDLFLTHPIGAVPVVDREQLVGIVSYIDVLAKLRGRV